MKMLEKLKTSAFGWKKLYQQEETMWTQKVLWDWIINGDRNSKYFQMVARNHRLWNRIQQIKDDQGCWVDSQEGIFQSFQNYFRRLYTSQQTYKANQIQEQLSIVPMPTVSKEKKMKLEEPVQNEEIIQALFQIGPFKALGPDGLPAAFYQRY